MDDETGAQRGQVASLKSHGWERAEWGVGLSTSGFRVCAARNGRQGPRQERSHGPVEKPGFYSNINKEPHESSQGSREVI